MLRLRSSGRASTTSVTRGLCGGDAPECGLAITERTSERRNGVTGEPANWRAGEREPSMISCSGSPVHRLASFISWVEPSARPRHMGENRRAPEELTRWRDDSARRRRSRLVRHVRWPPYERGVPDAAWPSRRRRADRNCRACSVRELSPVAVRLCGADLARRGWRRGDCSGRGSTRALQASTPRLVPNLQPTPGTEPTAHPASVTSATAP